MREKIIFIDFLVTVIILPLIILLFIIEMVTGIRTVLLSWGLCFLLYYYSIIKSILGIILFIKNIIQKNIFVVQKKILFLFIPSLLLIIYIAYFSHYLLPILFRVGYKKLIRSIIIESIILSIGCLAILCYYILNKTLPTKMHKKIIYAILLPITYFTGYFIVWAIAMA
jgi:hypothetical protein